MKFSFVRLRFAALLLLAICAATLLLAVRAQAGSPTTSARQQRTLVGTTAAPDALGQGADATPVGRRSFLPLVRSVRPTPTPTPIPPNMVLNATCYWFELGPSDRDDVECSPTNGLVISRYNISFSMVACCGTSGAKHYAVSVDAAKTAGDGDYRIGFDVRSLLQGGGYLFGVNPDTRSYSLYRIDDSDWKGGTALIPWTPSDFILPGSQFNRLEVERNNALITLRINGQQVAALQETTWLDQGIGWTLYARNYQGGAQMRFERIRYMQWNR